jgi:glycerophosphoryl diester phosphodiesterase
MTADPTTHWHGPGSASRAIVVAHRGRSGPEPENSTAAIEATLARGVTAIEIDVRSTSDGALVLAHDPDLGGIEVATATLAHLERSSDCSPALLSEVVALVAGRALLDVEVKESGYEAAVAAVLRASTEPADLLVTSFLDDVVGRMRVLLPHVSVGLLLGLESPPGLLTTRAREVFPEARLRATGADIVAPNHALLRAGFLTRMRRGGTGVVVWTVNDDALLARLMADERIDAVVTDEPLRAMALRDAPPGGD